MKISIFGARKLVITKIRRKKKMSGTACRKKVLYKCIWYRKIELQLPKNSTKGMLI